MATEPIRVLVVDDSALMRNLVSRIINDSDDLVVVGTAMNGQFAVEKIPKLKPEVIVLDLEMPTMTGVQFLQHRKQQGWEMPVIVLSSIAQRGAQITMEALGLGASDFIPKPSGSISLDIEAVAEQLQSMVRGYGLKFREVHPESATAVAPDSRKSASPAAVLLRARPAAPPTAPPPRIEPRQKPGRIEVVALGISTGGPNALRQVLPELKPSLGVPFLIVQHMPAGFTREFAESLDRISEITVREAVDGERLEPNVALVAPGDYHLSVVREAGVAKARVMQTDPVNGHRPSAGVLFRSIAEVYGNHALAVIMTGMGRDGAFEIGSIHTQGGITIGQDEASSVVYGMPRVAYENGFIARQVPLERIAAEISGVVEGQRS